MAYICRIKSNVKKGVDVELGPLTLIVGENASGKSSVVTSAELLLCGTTVEVGGVPADLMALATSGSPELEVTGVLDTKRELRFAVSGSTSRASKPKWNGVGHGVILSSLIADVLQREPKRRREAFLRAACQASAIDVAIETEIPPAFREVWLPIWDRARNTNDTQADALVAAIELVRVEIRKARAEAKVDVALVLAPSDSDIASAQTKLNALRTRKDAVERVGALRASLEMYERELGESRAVPADDFKFTQDRVVALVAAVHVLEFMRVVANKVPEPSLPCPVCEKACDTALLAQLSDRAAARAQKARDILANTRGGVDVGKIEWLQAQVDSVRKELKESSEVTAPKDGEIESVYAHLQRLLTDQAQAQMADTQRIQATRAAARVDVLTGLEKTLDRIVASLLESQVASFCTSASRALPNSERLTLQLFDGDRKVCRLGVNDRPWQTLSGAERARCIAALASGWSAQHTENVRLVVVDDVWLGPFALAALCAGLKAVVGTDRGPTQAIVCAASLESSHGTYVVDGWKVVEV